MAQISDQQYQLQTGESIPGYNKRILDLRGSQTSGYADTLSNPTPTDPSTSSSSSQDVMNQVGNLLRKYQQGFTQSGYGAQQEQARRLGAPVSSDLIGASPSVQSGVRSADVNAIQPTISGLRAGVGEIQDALTMINEHQNRQEKMQNDLYKRVHDKFTMLGGDAFKDEDPQTIAKLEKSSGLPAGYISKFGQTFKDREAQLQQDKLQLSRAAAISGKNEALTASRWAMASNRIVSNYTKLPIYQNLSGASVYLGRIEAAKQVPGSISDQDLLDSYTKLNIGNYAVTQAQVGLIMKGRSLKDTASVWVNKLSKGGVLSDDQRNQLTQVVNKVYENYKKQWAPIYKKVTNQLQAAGIPEQYWTLPDLENLSNMGGDTGNMGSTETQGAEGGTTTMMTSPDGSKWNVPNDKVSVFQQNGYK